MKLKLYIGRMQCRRDRLDVVLETVDMIHPLKEGIDAGSAMHTVVHVAVSGEDLRKMHELQAAFTALLVAGDVIQGEFWISEVEF
jgi:hypothetical protein